MNKPTVKKTDSYLHSQHQDFKVLLFKIKLLQDLNSRFSLYLDKAMLPFCQVANLVDDRLVVIAANGSIATQLRFSKMDLLIQFKQDALLSKVKDIHFKVSPSSTPSHFSTRAKKSMPLLSHQTAEIIKDVAASLKDDKLKDTLHRIASHIEKPHLKGEK